MRAVRRRLRACAWLAVLSIIALAAGPTVSRLVLPPGPALVSGAAAHAPHDQSTGAATASLERLAPADQHQHHHHEAMGAATAPPSSPPPAHDHALEHCGLCLLAAHAFTFVQAPPALAGFVACTRPALDPMGPAAPRLRCDWSPASSRGPPRRA